uniref:mandelate racemase/muconate lactonizing enzyme family protein n=1 Tax=Marinobacterium profundum TaxID=1714300 RepID=UPI0008296826|nr:enolase C-terminal domain-like protein [Marinobacterium profundum]
MQAPIVQTIELFAVGPDGEKVSWSSHLGPMCEAMIITRLTFDNGLQGIAGLTTYTEHEFDQTAFHSASLMAPFLLGKPLDAIAEIAADMAGRYVPLKNLSQSLFDIALHDAKAKSQGLPLYKMLGGAKDKVRAYASSPLLETVEDYIAYCHSMLEQGFNAIKIHPRCVFTEDMALVKALHAEFTGTAIGWSLDVDSNYNYDQALEMGKLLDECDWEFFEEPLPDSDLAGYRKLAAELRLDVIAGGNSMPHPQLIEYALELGCWDRSRFDVTSIGGYTGATRVMEATCKRGLKAEVQSWGYTLTQAANLHLMLAYDNCDYFEQAAPYEKYEVGAKQVFRPDPDGYIHPTELPGLGVELDWDALQPFIYQRRTFDLRDV